jgi:hypothetical protein
MRGSGLRGSARGAVRGAAAVRPLVRARLPASARARASAARASPDVYAPPGTPRVWPRRCVGLRGEGDAGTGHPRCVSCDGAAAAPSSACGAGPPPPPDGDCFFCSEPLASKPCVQLGCPGRHVAHLACCQERLRVGYPGPHISFAHLYCPACRTAGGGGGGAAGAGQGYGQVRLGGP